MGEKEKQVIGSIAEALPTMNDFEKGYLLGVAESNRKEEDRRKEENNSK